MATTALQIEEENGSIKRLLFMTVPTPTGVDVDIFMADEEFTPVGSVSLGISELNEVDYHTSLRQQASEKGQFIPDFSTDPQLNPGYKNEEEGSI